MKRLPVRWARAASLDVTEIVEFVKQDRPEAAGNLGRALLAGAPRLSRNPRQGRVVPELFEKGISDYRELIISSYRLIYAIRAHYIDIVVVLDSRRDLEAALFQRLMR